MQIKNHYKKRIIRIFFGEKIYEKIKYYVAIRKYVTKNQSIISKLVQPNDIAIDVGANIGGISYVLSKICGDQGRVYRIEPNLSAYNFLCKTIKDYSLHNAKPYNIAIGNQNTILDLIIPTFGSLQVDTRSTINPETINKYSKDRSINKLFHQPIQVLTIDNFCADNSIDHVDFIKEDTEGHTLGVIEGSKKTNKKSLPTLYFEIQHESKHLKKLKELGYEIFVDLCNGFIKKYSQVSKDEQYDESNTILIHQLKISKYDKIICDP